MGLDEGINITWTPFFLKALSLTIKEFPLINASVDMENHKVYQHPHHNVGVAVATPLGLIVPVLHDIQNLSFRELFFKFEELKQKAFNNQLKQHDFKDGTISLSNFGVLEGRDNGLLHINHPQVAILAVARLQKQPVVKKRCYSGM